MAQFSIRIQWTFTRSLPFARAIVRICPTWLAYASSCPTLLKRKNHGFQKVPNTDLGDPRVTIDRIQQIL